MKTKIYFIIALLLLGIYTHAQIKGQVQAIQNTVKLIKENGFDRIISDENLFINEPGNPQLPVLTKSYLIPVNADGVTVNAQSASKQKIEGQYIIYPAQPPVPTDGSIDSVYMVKPDSKIYESETPFPGKLAEIISDEFYLGYRIVTVRLYPFEYLPKKKELYSYDINISINYALTKSLKKEIVGTQNQTLYRYELNKKAIKFRVDNPDAVDSYDTKVQNIVQGKTIVYNASTTSNAGLRSQAISVLDEQVPDYIIITCDSLKTAFQPLADWKTKKGIFTIIQTVEIIDQNYPGSDSQEKIRNYIIESKKKWGNGLYILLGGGVNVIPARMVNGIFINKEQHHALTYPTDMYYATYINSWNNNGNNKFNEYEYIINSNGYWSQTINHDLADYSLGVILGRTPVENKTEASVWINKIIAYERANNLGDLNYLKNNLYSDAYMSNSNGYLSIFDMSSIKSYTSNYVSSWINNKFICDNAYCTGNSAWYTGSCPGGNIELNRDNFLSCLNTGAGLGVGKFHFIYHMDHSSATSIGTSSKDKGQSINRTDMDNLTNGTSYQIMMSGGCHPANFQYDCFGRHYLINPNSGGVTFIGNTDSGWSGEYSQLRYFFNAIYNTGRYDIGSAFQNSLSGTSYGNENAQRKWRLHLLGDPEMQVWTNTPQTFNDTISPTSIQTGAQTLTVTVSGLSLPSGETALICISKGTEVYETKTISGNGSYTFPVNAETPGTMYVTVTAHNYKPVEKTVSVNTSSMPNILISSINFIDNGNGGSVGNGNGKNDAGETILAQLTLKNNGALTAYNLTGTLTSTSGYVTVLNSQAMINSIAAGNTTVSQFRYQIDRDAPEIAANEPNSVQFRLELEDDMGVTWTKTFNIDVFATDLKQRNKVNINPSTITANKTVTFNIELQNMGQASTKGLTAILTSNNATNIVSSCSSTSHSYPAIGKSETKTASTTFQFTTGTACSANTTLNFTLTVTDAYGKTTTFPFTLTKPASVTNLKSSAKERSIDLSWNAVSGASGYNIYRCNVGANNTESGNYVRLNSQPVTFQFFNDASGLNTLTKYYYKVTSLSQTGMESNPVQVLAWTSYSTKGLYPVTMDAGLSGAALESHWVAEDIDNDGKKEIFSALSGGDSGGVGRLIALDWEGKELFDIDNNVTTYSGFADLSTSIRAGVAIGDINRDGINEIISLTRGFENNYADNLITCHIARDFDGDHKPDTLWQNPVQRTFRRGAIIDNLDNSPDGSMEIVAMSCGNSNAFPHVIEIYNAQGTLIQELSLGNAKFAYSAAAVADLDGDGDKEIIAGLNDGVYVWHHNGTSFGAANPFYSLSDYSLGSSPIICDINNDGEKEILLSAYKILKPDSCQILAIKTNGQLLSGWSTSGANSYKSTSTSTYTRNLSKEIVVGDLNGDGNLEVVAVGFNCIKIWNKDGTLFNTISLSGLESQFRTPLLADIDGDPEIEIIVTSDTEGKIYGLKRDGSSVLGFPLETAQIFPDATPVIADLDNNGKSEIVAGTGTDKKIYVWETNGNPSRIEWESARHDARNTGEYYKICDPAIINSSTTWNTNRSICGDLLVKSGTLTINNNSNITMDSSSMVIVMSGATLQINSGHLLNSNVKILRGGNLIISNDGSIKIRNNGELNVTSGAFFDFQTGSVSY